MNVADKRGQHQHRGVQAQHLQDSEDPVPAQAGDIVEHVQAGLRRRPPVSAQKQPDQLHEVPGRAIHLRGGGEGRGEPRLRPGMPRVQPAPTGK